MKIAGCCPSCQSQYRAAVSDAGESVTCPQCGWNRKVAGADIRDDRPARCLACGCSDLWRQKDFPQKLGLGLVVIAVILATIATAKYLPTVAIGVLLAFGLLDMLLYIMMRDVLVCYRCGARHGGFELDREHPIFNLETAERYRQESIRLEESTKQNS